MNSQSKARRITTWIITGLITLLFTASAVSKIMGAQPAVEGFEKWGLRDHLLLIGVGELISAWLFFIPRTSSLGLLLLSAYLGGAIVTHMQHGEPYFAAAVILLVVWIAGYLRHPEILQSFHASNA